MLADSGEAILFVDDDMRLPPDYLKTLIIGMQKLSADAVRGKMRIIEESGHVQSSRRASLLSRSDMLPGNGVLVVAKIFGEWGLRFDERFIGGFEDGDFFYRAYLRGARLFSLEHAHFWEFRPQTRMPSGNRKEELTGLMAVRRAHVSVRKYRGGLWRALLYICRCGVPLVLKIIWRVVTLPFSLKRNLNKIQNNAYRLVGLIQGLWLFQIPLEETTGR